MISQESLEEAILSLLCFNDELAIKIALRIDNATLFSKNRTNQKLAKTTIEYIKKYGNAPGMALEYLLEVDMNRGEEGKLLHNQLDFLSKRVLEVDSTFVLDQLDRFIEVQHLQNNLQQALEHLDEGDLERARDAAFKNNSKEEDNPGIWFADPRQALAYLDQVEFGDYFSSGVGIFDKIGIRLDKKCFGFIIAAKGKGKSWWLIEVGKCGIQHHHKILHITLELSQEKTSLRYLQSVFALTKREAMQVRIPVFNREPVTGAVSIEFSEVVKNSVFEKRADIHQKLSRMIHTQLLIKEFPASTLSIENLYLYMEQLKREKGFEPDLLIIDYADLMKIDASQLRIDTGRLYKELRGMATSKNVALASATQGNRESASAKVVQNTNVAEDWSKIATADLVLTYTQTPQEHKMGLARVFVANARDEEDKKLALISQNYPTGQFCLDSILMNADVAQQMATMNSTS